MSRVTNLILDVLKPHHPNALEFAARLAEVGEGYDVSLVIEEVDEKTETAVVRITSADIDFELISRAIEEMGASIHSIDEVVVSGRAVAK